MLIASRKKELLDGVANKLNRLQKGTCIAIVSDLGTKDAAVRLAESVATHTNVLHLLVNCAGMSWGGNMLDFDESNGWDRLFALNVKSIFYLTMALVPLLEAAANGNIDPARVINISSVAGTIASAETPLASKESGTWSYNISKAAVDHLTRSLAVSLASRNITVNAIAPGIFPSRMTAYGIKHGGNVVVASQPSKRIGNADDMA